MLYSVELRNHSVFAKLSDPDRIQTCNLLIRSQMLYSVELRSHFYLQYYKRFYDKFHTETNGDPDRIQTCNLLIRSQMLYSVELRNHCFSFACAKVVNVIKPPKYFGEIFRFLFDKMGVVEQETDVYTHVPVVAWKAIMIAVN